MGEQHEVLTLIMSHLNQWSVCVRVKLLRLQASLSSTMARSLYQTGARKPLMNNI